MPGKNIITTEFKDCVTWGYMHMGTIFIAHNAKTGVCSLYMESTCEDDKKYAGFISYKLNMGMADRREVFNDFANIKG